MKKILLFLFSVLVVCLAHAQETEEPHNPAEYISGTLPVLYITTEDSVPVTSKETYLAGTYYLDNLGLEGYEAIGSASNQLPLLIKGRGNSSWEGYDKKPYRIKLDKKQALLGMNRNKHWCLMAYAGGPYGPFRDETAFQLSRMMGMEWTPAQRPVELVLNGDYKGLYHIAEKIRVDTDRVNIAEQDDEETDPACITGGWLVEIDNYREEGQVRIFDGEGQLMRFMPQSPEVLSDAQREYLTDLVTTVDSLIHQPDKTSTEWENYVDIDALARFYVVNEIMDNCEAFNGSCYWHKERGKSTKIVFGPVWDFGSSLSHLRYDSFNYFIYEMVPPYSVSHWIQAFAKYPNFQNKVREIWGEFQETGYQVLREHINSHVDKVRKACDSDYRRWPQYGIKASILNNRVNLWFHYLSLKEAFLRWMWSEPYPLQGDLNFDTYVNTADISVLYNAILSTDNPPARYDLNGDGAVNAGDISTLYQLILINN